MPITNQPNKPRARRARIRRILLLGSALFLGAWAFQVVRRPFAVAAEMRAENARIEQRVLQEKLTSQVKRKQLRAMQSDAGMEREARRLGYVRKDELPLIIPDTRQP
jgi:hypothetical protein